ncbi:MAG: hypothetical protein OEV06_10910 [Anaerolineae bacterium]|nr:hypothetical protein [Anaerolineae bacterium]
MLDWLKTPSGVIATSGLSLMSFIARSLLDWRYTFPYLMEMTTGIVAGMLLWNVLFAALWVFGMVNLRPDRKAAFRILMSMNVFHLVFNGILSTLAMCPSPCPTLWPVGEIIIQSGTLTGFLGVLSLWLYRRHNRKFVF